MSHVNSTHVNATHVNATHVNATHVNVTHVNSHVTPAQKSNKRTKEPKEDNRVGSHAGTHLTLAHA